MDMLVIVELGYTDLSLSPGETFCPVETYSRIYRKENLITKVMTYYIVLFEI